MAHIGIRLIDETSPLNSATRKSGVVFDSSQIILCDDIAVELLDLWHSMEFPATAWSEPPSEFELLESEVVIWRAALDCEQSVLRRLEATLSPDERSRANRFHFCKDRDHFIAGRGILRSLIGSYLRRDPAEIKFGYGPQGKPDLAVDRADPSLTFNLSHKQGLAVYAFARERQLGIDLEAVASSFPGEDIARRFFSPGEVEELLALPPDLRSKGFFLAWTRKEAYIKARGHGLQIPLDSFDVSLTPGRPPRLLTRVGIEWQIISFEVGPDTPGALVFDGSQASAIHFFEWRPPSQVETHRMSNSD